eukprot:9335023-Lingulodinium_polyedra.AAC.1
MDEHGLPGALAASPQPAPARLGGRGNARLPRAAGDLAAHGLKVPVDGLIGPQHDLMVPGAESHDLE